MTSARAIADDLARAIEAATAFLGRPVSDAEIRKIAGAVARHPLAAPPVAASGLH